MRKVLIPVILVMYSAMVLLHSVVENSHDEIFPFFSWSLFSTTPGWYSTENTLSVDSIDGDSTKAIRYLIPSNSASDQKVLRRAVNACIKNLSCDEVIEEVLYPTVIRLVGEEEGTAIDFTITRSRIDLREVQKNIDKLANGTVTRADFFQPYRVIGRWNISN